MGASSVNRSKEMNFRESQASKMAKHTAISRDRFAGGLLLGALAAGLAAAVLGAAGTASATCASINGVGNGNGCTSTATSFAVGLGPNTTANASGLFDGAVANGFSGTQGTL